MDCVELVECGASVSSGGDSKDWRRTAARSARSVAVLFLCACSVTLSAPAYGDEATDALSDPNTPLPPNAQGSVSAWDDGIEEMKGGVASLEGGVISLDGGVVSFKDALADLIGSLKGWELIDDDMFYLVRMDSDLLFDFDSAELRPQAKDALIRFAEVLAPYEKKELSITGHTDSKGTDQYNDKLSQRRAQSVKGFLDGTKKLSGWRFTVKGKGEREPIAPNETPDGKDDPAGRQKNRRVELRIPKIKK